MIDSLCGLALVNFHVSDHLKEFLEELPPIFKKTEAKRIDLTGHLKWLPEPK